MQHAGKQHDVYLAQQLCFSQYEGRSITVADNMDPTPQDAEESDNVR
jgi:hypothetical protein